MTPKRLGLNHEEHTFYAEDKTQLSGWLIPNQSKKVKKSRGLVVLFHGNAQNISTHFANLAWVVKEGYDLFIWDYRGYGKSEGESTPDGIFQDSLAALDHVRKLSRNKSYKKLILFGQSLGGVVLMRALEEDRFNKTGDFVVLDSTFSSYQDIAFDRLKSSAVTFIFSPISYLLISDQYAPKRFLTENKRPTLVIHGDADQVVPLNFGKEIYEKLQTKRKWLWKIPKGRHICAFCEEGPKNRDKFLKLISEI